MKHYSAAKELPFIPVGTEFEYTNGDYELYSLTTENNNIVNFTPEEMEILKEKGWVRETTGKPVSSKMELPEQKKRTVKKPNQMKIQ